VESFPTAVRTEGAGTGRGRGDVPEKGGSPGEVAVTPPATLARTCPYTCWDTCAMTCATGATALLGACDPDPIFRRRR
jgi:hypothetical protein